MKRKCVCSIGGQAILDGVMMRGQKAMAMAVRAPDGTIMIESERFTQPLSAKKVSKIPVLRGVVNFVNSLVVGMKTTTRSTEVFGADDEEPTKFEKWLSKTFHVDIMSVITFVGVVLGVILSLGLFVVIPNLVAWGIFQIPGLPSIQSPFGAELSSDNYSFGENFGYNVLYNLITGVLRMSIFILYIGMISKMKEIKRLFMYHGAEHKTISCYEHGLELTPENAQKFSTQHDRCGTTFLFIVMVVSILFFTVLPIDMLVPVGGFLQILVRILVRIALVPVVAGVSYEFLKLFAKYDTKFSRAMKKPGLLLQKLTTKEPELDMLEVAISAFNEVVMLEQDESYPTKKFVIFSTPEQVVKKLSTYVESKEERELIVMFVTGAKTRSELYDGRTLTEDQGKRAIEYGKRCQKGAPVQYVLGSTCFYGYDFICDSRVLIPRGDTEILCEQAIKKCKEFEKPAVLDICTGSGAVAIALAKNTDAVVTASDISPDAVEVAKLNAERLRADVDVKLGSFFVPHRGKKFDIITANPPYIPSGEIASLDKSVREYEPRLALDGGTDGLDAYRDIIDQAKGYLTAKGYLLLEVGIHQAKYVAELLEKDFDHIEFFEDYNTPPVQRVVSAQKKEEE